MAHTDKVIWSLGSPCGLRCVDIVAAPDGVFGWAGYRRDPEDGHGWRPDGSAETGFGTAEDALRAARAGVGWLEDA